MWNFPKIEVSWDKGKTWTEQYGPCCGAGVLARVVSADGKVIWQGRGIAVPKTCSGCDGKGIRDEYEFVEEKPGED